MISSLSGADFTGREAMYLGVAKSVVVTKENTVIVRHDDTPIEPIDGKVAELKEQAKLADKNYVLRKNIESRIAKLSGGISMIKVGGITPAEVEEKIARVDDAVGAVRSAKEEGIVAGGGMALLSAIDKLDLDEVTKKSISAPFMRILANADFKLPLAKEESKWSFKEIVKVLFNCFKEDDVITLKAPTYPNGYDVKNFKEVNMFDAGIIDAKKVVKNALINSISASNTLLRSANVLTYKNK
jgi:chaperonin GroEL